jgi:hypothetical protein
MRPHYFLALAALVTSCHSRPDLVPQAAQYRYNGSNYTFDGVTRHDPLAAFVFKTAAREVEISAKTDCPAPYIVGSTITASIDGKSDTTFALIASKQAQYFTLPLPGGEHEIELVEGAQIKPEANHERYFTSITGLSVPKGSTITVLPIPYAQEGIVVFGDSRTVGGAGNHTSKTAWPLLIRHLRGADVFTIGYGSMRVGDHLHSPTKQDSLIREISARLTPYKKKVVWVEAGVVDYASADYTPMQLKTYYQQWLPKLKQAIPGVRVFVQTDIWKKGEGTNRAGFTLPQYRAGEQAGAEGLATVIDGRMLADSTTLQDGVHQSALGDAGIAKKVNAVLDSGR